MVSSLLWLLLVLWVPRTARGVGEPLTTHPTWVVNAPLVFHHALDVAQLSHHDLVNVSQSEHESFFNYHIPRTDGFTDGEIVDVIEHFFWGRRKGLAMELGALDGSSGTRSMTFELENTFGWKRILIEGNPTYVKALKARSPHALSVSAAICDQERKVHFSDAAYVGGIIEFMDEKFLQQYHAAVYNAQRDKTNVSSVDWSQPAVSALAHEIDCVPLATVLHKAHARHVNFFILDVEGGELQVLRSVNWNETRFDVLCIETDPPNRPQGFRDSIAAFLGQRGYVDYSGQQGRNSWFTHKSFVPSARPGLNASCFNGVRKSEWSERWFANRRTPPFQACPIG